LSNAKAEARPAAHGQNNSEDDRGVEALAERQCTDAEFEPVLEAQREEAWPGIRGGNEYDLGTPPETPTPPEERGQPAASWRRHSSDEITGYQVTRELGYTPPPEYHKKAESFQERAESFVGVDSEEKIGNFEGVGLSNELPVRPTVEEITGYKSFLGDVRNFYEDSDSDTSQDGIALEREWFSHHTVL